MKQQVRFCTAAGGVRLAYAVHGKGFPLVRVGTWLSHLELDWESPVWRHWLKRLGERHTVVRYDERGCGLSDAYIGDPSVDVWVGDLETVIDAVGLERFALLGVSQAAAIAVAYAARHPDRVSDLVLYGGYARGRRFRSQDEEEDPIVAAIRAGWTTPNPAFRRVFSMLFVPDGTPEQMAWYEDLLWRSTTAEAAIRLFRARGGLNVCELAPQVRARTLVMHARDDRVEYTLAGADLLLHRIGWSVQVPARQAAERDEARIATWRQEVWPVVKGPRRTWAPGSVSRTSQARG